MLKEPEMIQVQFGKIQPWGDNPRSITKQKLKELSESIEKKGLFQVLPCWKKDKIYETAGGNMRWQAMKHILKYPDNKLIWISLNFPKNEAEKIELALLDNMKFGKTDEQALAELIYPHVEEINLEDYNIDRSESVNISRMLDDFAPGEIKEQARLDKLAEKEKVKCPECGCEFLP